MSGRTNTILWLPIAALLATGCSILVEDALKARDTDAGGRPDGGTTDAGTADAGTDAGPQGETCTSDEQCISFDPFNCNRVCGAGGRCEAGAAPDGTRCGMGPNMHCVARTCVVRSCGDGFVDRTATPPEYCDDGNTNDADACNNACTRSCAPPAPAVCADTNPCNGEETCRTSDSLCQTTGPAPDGTACPMRTGPMGVCAAGVCVAE